jgi:3',5'-cyclic AMP phosphodiesterase CpdA
LLELDFAALAGLPAGKALSFIAIGGDVTSHGKAAGFTRFADEALPSLQRMVARREAICAVPGNHDVVWGLDPIGSGYFNEKFKSFVKLVDETGMSSCLIPKGQLRLDASDQHHDLGFDPPRNGPLYVDQEDRVLVLNVNSAIRCGELNRKMCLDLLKHAKQLAAISARTDPAGAGDCEIDKNIALKLSQFHKELWSDLLRDVAHVTQLQLRRLREKLTTKRSQLGEAWESYLRVALVHHHVMPFPGQHSEHKGYESMVDSSQLLDLLTSFDFDIVLTGHKHQPYQLQNNFNTKDIFVIGGPTVGGHTSGESFRGFQLVEFDSDEFGRKVAVRDIECRFARGDMQEAVKRARSHELSSKMPLEWIMDRAASRSGYTYKDIVSITKLTEDGDGRRIVECDDLIINNKMSPRRWGHSITLPPTSGYLDQFRATGKGFSVSAKGKTSMEENAKAANIELSFAPPLRINSAANYRYEWYAVNGFALDKLQFTRKYGGDGDFPLRDFEYTHFIPVDPIERLTVIVQFPKGLVLPYPPTLRIARVEAANVNSRTWEVDEETTQSLDRSRALRYYETLNIAALRVRFPKVGLSYGIQWTLPDAPEPVASNRLAKIVRRLETSSDDSLRRVYRVLQGSRDSLLSGWDKDLDATLMIFSMAGNAGKLKAAAAGHMPGPAESIQRLSRDFELLYGDGITGRAFKVNRIRIYVDPSSDSNHRLPAENTNRMEPNFYKPVPGTLSHKALIAFPIHLPVKDHEFEDEPSIYEHREPYGVLNIGSQSDDCPMGELLLAKRAPELLHFQHFVNKMLSDPT